MWTEVCYIKSIPVNCANEYKNRKYRGQQIILMDLDLLTVLICIILMDLALLTVLAEQIHTIYK
jgi:hypothetical protein